jgi:hypothetical protein
MAPASLFAQNPVAPGSTQPPPAVASAPAPQTDATFVNPLAPIDLNRIKKLVDQDPTLKLDGVNLRYYVTVVAKQPKFSDYIGDFDFKNGVVPGAGMTYKEFMGQVTPKQLYGSGGFTATELLTSGLVNLAGQAIIKRGLKALHDARTQGQVDAIRARIDRELAALLGKGN